MSRCFQMPSLDRASYLAGVLQGAEIHAHAEVRSAQPLLVVACHRRDVDDAILSIEPQAQLVLA